jgi:peptide/nickel transport system substrate-binding protein
MATESEYWRNFWRRRLSRRRLLQASALGGTGLAVAGVVGCGDDEGDGGDGDGGTATASPTQGQPVAGGTFHGPLVGTSTGNPPTLDAQRQLTFLAQIPAAYHYSRLLKFAPGETEEREDATSVLIDFSNVEGDACEDVPEVIDGAQFNFKIRDNLNFHNVEPLNGRTVSADDVKASLDIFAAESPNRGNWLSQVESVEVTGPKEFTVKLRQPFAPAFQVLFANNDGGPWIIAQEILTTPDRINTNPVGSGPWIFESWEPNVVMRWRKNPDYYDKPKPYIENIEATLVADPEVILQNLKEGNFDGALWTAYLWDRGLSEFPDGQWFTGPEHVWGGAYFNYANPPFDRKEVRQAFSMAIDRQGILEALDQPGAVGGGAGLTHISQFARFYLDPINDAATFGENAKYYQRDVQAARQLLEAAGFGDGIDLTANSSNIYGAGFSAMMNAIAASVQEAGFNMELNLGEYGGYLQTTFLGDIPPNAFGLAPLMGSPMDPHNIFFTIFHPSSARHNWGPKGAVPAAELPRAGDNSPAGDATLLGLWTKQAQELDLDARIEVVHDVQRNMAESMWLVPWPGVSTAYTYQPWVKGIELTRGYAYGVEALVNMWIDKG